MGDLQSQHPEAYENCNLSIAKADCTLETCCLAQSYFLYRPDYGGNVFFAVFFSLMIIPHIGLGIKFKTWGYMAGMSFGLLLEAIGYIARVGLHNNPYDNNAFLMYLIALTIAPVFITAAIYLCLTRIIVLWGEHLSYFKPRTIAIAFMTSDLLSLVLQAVGGGWAETAIQNDEDSQGGINVMIAGLLLQALSLAAFVALWAWFQLRTTRKMPDQNPEKVFTRKRTLFYVFSAALLLATVAILVRSIYRVAELWGGFAGELWNNQKEFMLLDGTMLALAVILLTVLHPGPAFGGQWNAANWSLKGSSRKGLRQSSKPLGEEEREMRVLWK